ncbi:hypothetical protein NLI96_g4359 [Meripilus lineatus]|uniref:Uncharacterized protein n=1 Tax=Meripilus lineatus TaxID=2056292 RepID=A0AAD5V561_9APHY|nr:hypothetical protein NLI96_g4359 [Physisporinus lineatus]
MTEGRLPATSMSGGNVTEHVEALAVGIASGVAGLVFITMLSIFILRRRRHFAPQKKEISVGPSFALCSEDTSVKPFRNTPPHVRAPNLQADDAAVAIEDGSESYSLVVNVSENITDSVPGADAQHQPNQPSPSLAKNENEDSNLLAGNVDKPRSANTKVPVVGGGTRAVLRQYSDSGIRFEPPSPVEFIDLPPAYTQS